MDWDLQQDLCRCCHATGKFQSLQAPVTDSEVCTDILQNCLHIELIPMPGELSNASYSICNGCILKLQDVRDFKKQVLLCEERLKEFISHLNVVKVEPSIEPNADDYFPAEGSEDELLNQQFNSNDYEIMSLKDKGNKKVKKESKKSSKSKTKGKVKTRKKPKVEVEIKTETADDTLDGDAEKSERNKFVLNEDDYKQYGDQYTCVRCDRKYTKFLSLRFHIKTKHYKIPRFKCKYCDQKFMTLAPLTVHKLEEHKVDERFHCKACNCVFNTKVQLRKHINNFHMLGEKIKCESCEYETFSFESMYKHKFKHKTVKDFHCRFCRKSFLRKATLDLHERIHTGDRRKICKVCGQAFVQKASLNYHMTKYHPEINF